MKASKYFYEIFLKKKSSTLLPSEMQRLNFDAFPVGVGDGGADVGGGRPNVTDGDLDRVPVSNYPCQAGSKSLYILNTKYAFYIL